jgi:hypothetical protein
LTALITEKSMVRQHSRIWLLACFLISAALFQFSFYWNGVGVVNPNWFSNHAYMDEALVFARLKANDKHGITSYGAFLVLCNDLSMLTMRDPDKALPKVCWPYRSETGAQGTFFSALNLGLQQFYVPARLRLATFQFMTALALAVVLAAFVAMLLRDFGFGVALAVFASLLFSPWLTVFARNLYYVFFLFFLPFVWNWHVYSRMDASDFPDHNLFFVTGGLIFIKALIVGFYYITTVALAASVPAIFWLSLRGSSSMVLARHVTVIFLAALTGFAAAMVLHLIRLSVVEGDISAALAYMTERAALRTYGVSESLLDVLGSYIKMRYDDLSDIFSIAMLGIHLPNVVVLPALTIFVFLRSSVFARPTEEACRVALLLSSIAAIAAPLSWHVLAKGHSSVHVWLNYVLWYLPAVPMLVLAAALLVKSDLRRSALAAIPTTVIAVFLAHALGTF